MRVEELIESAEAEQFTTVMKALDCMLSALHCIYPKLMARVRMGPLLMVLGRVTEVLYEEMLMVFVTVGVMETVRMRVVKDSVVSIYCYTKRVSEYMT